MTRALAAKQRDGGSLFVFGLRGAMFALRRAVISLRGGVTGLWSGVDVYFFGDVDFFFGLGIGAHAWSPNL